MISSSRPYLIRAIYNWLTDNRLTPYIMIDATFPKVVAPKQFIEDGKIVLNIAEQAVGSLSLANECVEFDASFSGVIHHIYVPIKAVKAIYAFENGRGMVFNEEDDGDDDGGDDKPTPPSSDGNPDEPAKPRGKGRPNLRIVK